MPEGSTFAGFVLGWAQAAAAFGVAGAAAFTDLRRGRVANRLCLAGAVLGLGLSYARGGWADGPVALRGSLLCMGVGFVLFAVFYALGGMGAGDVKLMAALGALAAEPVFLLWIVAYTALAGGAMGLFALWRRGVFWRGMGRSLAQMGRWRHPVPPPDGRPPWKRRAALPAPAPDADSVSPSGEARPVALSSPSPMKPEMASEAKKSGESNAPPATTSTPESTASLAVLETSESAEAEEKTAPLYLPYAAAVAAGLALATLQYVRRGLWPPFFWEGF